MFNLTSTASFQTASYRQLQLWLKSQPNCNVKLNSKKQILIEECLRIWKNLDITSPEEAIAFKNELNEQIEAETIADVNEWEYCLLSNRPTPKGDTCPSWFVLFFIWTFAILIILCAINPTVIALVMFSWLIGINIISNFLSFQKELWRSPWVNID